MGKKKITQRQRKILKNICDESGYITMSDIAKKLNISPRTVLRELKNMEEWVKDYECTLDKKPGVGIKLIGSVENKKKILDRLEKGSYIKNYSARERQVVILWELLQEKEPVKIFSFAHSFHVTEGTLSHDLDRIQYWLKDYHLELIRKPGLGIYIQGSEREIRRAMINLIYENIDEIQLLNLIRKNLSLEVDTREKLLNLIEKDTIQKLANLIMEIEGQLPYRLADNAYIGLLVHLALVVQRIRQNEKISMDKASLDNLKNYKEFQTAKDLGIKIAQTFHIEIPEEEIGYITMHLRGSRFFQKEHKNHPLEDLAKEMFKIAEAETGSFLEQNEQSIFWLASHLETAINRLKMKMDIRNPLLDEIKQYYSELFHVAEKCIVPVEKQFGIKMPDSEIAYIAMHLGAVLGRKNLSKKHYRVVIACATGIGTSSLLAARIEEEYTNIQVTEIISSLNIKEEELHQKGIDFIISTVPIELSKIPVVVVNPLFFEKDKKLVDYCIEKLKNKPIYYHQNSVDSYNLKEKLSQIYSYTEGILQILNNFFLLHYDEFNSISEIIDEVSHKVSQQEKEIIQIKKDLMAREEYGSTILTGLHSILLHCKTSGVKQLFFGAVKMETDLWIENAEEEKEAVNLAIILLVPQNCNKPQIEIVSFISSKLIEDPDFLQDLREGKKEKVYQKLNNLLDNFYQTKTNK